ncbi:RHS repeat-associated core domain protein [Leptospira vanthielii serovar Holland str. Waz Holland = ATCC 700522]|uniref:RHS repeat-associated core domain protein n=1 Tax=Leptospira vanthielii serovar Holland str. Waz Holland = ATCC 700522 TaxID=1218591 RepID=N1W335_9LEPT|nr:RHS repeat-associated core domain protein [Leptospira vanthielii serovar Holland str. Waz Holland = ATCC 700522]
MYYYKARYYDAALGRFVSNDGQVFPNKEQGMNRMMYVEGNPIAFVDPSGRNKHIHMFNRIVGHAMGKDFGDKMNNKFSSNSISKGFNRSIIGETFGQAGKKFDRFLHKQRVGIDKWLISNRNTYSEPFLKRYVKMTLLNKICEENGELSVACEMASFFATYDYFRSRENWENRRTPIPVLSPIINFFVFSSPNYRRRDSSRPLDIVYSYMCVTRLRAICGAYEE